jgi:hypothetical protein
VVLVLALPCESGSLEVLASCSHTLVIQVECSLPKVLGPEVLQLSDFEYFHIHNETLWSWDLSLHNTKLQVIYAVF